MSKQSALEKIDAMKTEPKRRRTAQEQAVAPLLKRHQLLVKRRDEALGKVYERFDGEIGGLLDAIHALGFDPTGATLDEQAQESE